MLTCNYLYGLHDLQFPYVLHDLHSLYAGFHKLILCLPDYGLIWPLLNVPTLSNVFSNFGKMCLSNNLADSAICGGLANIFMGTYLSNSIYNLAVVVAV